MKAIICNANDKLVWAEVPNPIIKPGDALIEIHAAAINRADLLQRAGQYPPPAGWPEWFGLEVAGVIVALGAEAQAQDEWHIGDQVCALLGGGGYAEYVACPTEMLMPIPKGVSMQEAAALPEAFGAAYLFLFYEARLRAGDTVLMQAGASGLASVVIPMARAFGARVLTTVLNEKVAESIVHLKADRVIDTSREDLAEVMDQELNVGHGVDICIDCLGGENVGRYMQHMNRLGRWIMIATLAGNMTKVDLCALYVRGTRLIGTTLRSRTPAQKKEILSEMVQKIWPKVENGEIRPTIWRTYPITEAEEAQRMMAEGRSVGKIVLTVK